MRKLLIICMAMFALVACDDAPKSDKPVIKIGAILPLVGDYNEAGEIAKSAIAMFERDIAKRDTKYSYKFIIEGNDGWDLKSSATLANKLARVDGVSAIISYWDASGQVVSQTVKDTNILHINMGASLQTIGEKNSFNIGPRTASEIKLSLGEMKRLGVKKLAVLYSNDSWATSQLTEYQKQVADFGIEIIAAEQINFGTKDFRGVFKKIDALGPDIISLVLEVPEFDIARKQMIETGIKIPVTTMQMTELAENMKNWEDTWYVMYPDGGDKFQRDFREFSKMRNTQNASIIYDMATIIVDAFENSDSVDRAIEWLGAQKTFDGIGGKYVQDFPRFFETSELIKEIKNGKPVVAK